MTYFFVFICAMFPISNLGRILTFNLKSSPVSHSCSKVIGPGHQRNLWTWKKKNQLQYFMLLFIYFLYITPCAQSVCKCRKRNASEGNKEISCPVSCSPNGTHVLCVPGRTTEVMNGFGRVYEQQFAVALFNKVRFDIEGGGGPQPQLLHRKVKYPFRV